MKIKILAIAAVLTLTACDDDQISTVVRQASDPVYSGSQEGLLSYGEQLWQDPTIGNSGLACGTCHTGGSALNATFKQPYPHYVAMVEDQTGLMSVTAEQMVQFCMLKPMQADMFAWDSKELAALTLYVESVVQPEYIKQHP
ncbi:MAG: hypothetical protein QNK26_02235 [Moritella sp.]|uniref:c-type cytochrome n=1 Tax=Moritella sp. TaxID=78556 RepID=UPI0029AA029F|nr:hypothetical protein [Moritella sp.]MDX2319397.1 hypothetical protein [Moritella sp.]